MIGLKILMVCTEYPPMHGGIGRYTYNLVKALQLKGIVDIKIVSSSEGNGDYKGLSPFNKNNTEVILNASKDMNPDIVHVQHEHGLYNFSLNPLLPFKSVTGIDDFYKKCKIPIVTTFHTAYPFLTWMQSVLVDGKDHLHLRYLYKFWTHLINYSSFMRINKYAMSKSATGIVLSKYLANLIPGSNVIYHGAEPFYSQEISQQEARKRLGLPLDKRILLVQGFLTATKGWDIIRRIKMPDGWIMVLNYSKNHYNKQIIDLKLDTRRNDIINLGKDYLSEQDLSLLFFASDAVFLPYKAIAGSGTMFDGLAHGKPFLASNVGFFKEFADMGLGIIANKRNTTSFEGGIRRVEKNYVKLVPNILEFKKQLIWNKTAQQHLDIYEQIIANKNNKRNINSISKIHIDLNHQKR